ncbi:hypothetical protein ANN_15335 [Periplaneta americana]|uniref:Reverse transcriptase domain-containing protein n=1 Tax=Periplaneta americana TaxID=6978 RepID=A0ABQ8SG42_PERAM|nr:hypothetical protein ANN_15335 [Periplaneta americana]
MTSLGFTITAIKHSLCNPQGTLITTEVDSAPHKYKCCPVFRKSDGERRIMENIPGIERLLTSQESSDEQLKPSIGNVSGTISKADNKVNLGVLPPEHSVKKLEEKNPGQESSSGVGSKQQTWSEVVRKKTKRITVIGKKANNYTSVSKLHGVPKYVPLHVYRLAPETKTDEVIEFIKPSFPEVKVEKLTNRQQCVFIDGNKSKLMNVKYGVPQGSVLGPILFLIMVNDLMCNVSAYSVVFADDATFLTSHSDINELKTLNEYDNAGKVSPGSSTESYPAFAHIGLEENIGKNLNQVKRLSRISPRYRTSSCCGTDGQLRYNGNAFSFLRRDGGAQLLITKLCTNMPGLNPKSLRSAYERKAYVTVDSDSSVG